MTGFEECMLRCGSIFMDTVWLQGQLSHLVLLRKNPEWIQEFVEHPLVLPKLMAKERIIYWEKSFEQVQKEFIRLFKDDLLKEEIESIELVMYLRNAIAHSYVTRARSFILYRPSSRHNIESKLEKAFGLVSFEGQADPMIMKVDFSIEENYLAFFQVIKNLDETCLERLCNVVGIPHGRIR